MKKIAEKVNGYKMYLWNAWPPIALILVQFNILPQDTVDAIQSISVETWQMLAGGHGLINIWLRKITTGPAGKILSRK